MKKVIKWKILIVTCIVCIIPIIFGVLCWDMLPEQIAIHFDINNNPDNYASKAFVVFGLPCLMVILQIICCLINDINAKKFGERKKFEMATKWIIPIMSMILYAITLVYALGISIDIRKCVMVIVGAVFIVIGNYMPKLDYIKNYNADTHQARKINRFIGFESVLMGIFAIVTIFLPPIVSIIWLFSLILYALTAIGYSVWIIKKG